MPQKIILEAIVGSTLYGTQSDSSSSDLDKIKVVVETPEEFMGFSTKDTWTFTTKEAEEQSTAEDIDETSYGLKKFLYLALKNNPTIINVLFIPDEFIIVKTLEWELIRQLAPFIVSKSAYFPFNGYMQHQYERLIGVRGQKNVTRPELVEKFGFDTKYAGHIIRLGYQGIELMKTGRITMPMPESERKHVVDVRKGMYFFDTVKKHMEELRNSLEVCYIQSPLADKPDTARVQKVMIDIYFNTWKIKYEQGVLF